MRRRPMTIANTARWMAFLLGLVITGVFSGNGMAASSIALSKGQNVYVPIYSHIYHGDHERPFELTATLSIRNTDPKHAITLLSADYFDSNGNFLKNYVEKPIQLKNLSSIRYIIKSTDTSGGSGAKFIVKWESAVSVNPPLIEAIMISTRSQQGISFISRGQVIND